MRNHTDLLNLIAIKINAYTYLEIGVQNPARNFDRIIAPFKVGVDPDPKANATCQETSDEYFAKSAANFDLIWIDGLHHADQVRKDIINAWEHLNPGGVIAIHDCNPRTKQLTVVPRGNQVEWTGDVYKTIINIQIPCFTIAFDYGICIIKKPTVPDIRYSAMIIEDDQVTWEEFSAHRKELLNLVTLEEAIRIINAW